MATSSAVTSTVTRSRTSRTGPSTSSAQLGPALVTTATGTPASLTRRMSSAAPGTVSTACPSVWACAIISAWIAPRFRPVHGPGTAARTSLARRPMNVCSYSASSTSAPQRSKKCRQVRRCTGSLCTSVPSRSRRSPAGRGRPGHDPAAGVQVNSGSPRTAEVPTATAGSTSSGFDCMTTTGHTAE